MADKTSAGSNPARTSLEAIATRLSVATNSAASMLTLASGTRGWSALGSSTGRRSSRRRTSLTVKNPA